MVYIEGKIYVSNNKKISKEILKKNHDLVDVGHPGQQRMLELLKRNYWWPGLKKTLENMYKNASSANRTKFNIRKNQKNYIYWKFYRDHGRKSVLI